MLLKPIIGSLLLAVCTSTASIPSPVEVIRRAHTTGTVITKCAIPGVLALAFDDGPYTYTQKLVDTLNAAGAKGTFFFTGTLYGCIYNQKTAVKNAYDSGHQISSHTWTHTSLGNLGASQIQTEMTRVEQAFVNIFGRKPAYMRPPNLSTSANMLSVLKQMNYVVITDDIDAGDWNHESAQSSEQKFQNAGASGNGHIPLMHETYDSTVNTLVPWLINWAKTNNLKIVTVAECLDDVDGMYQPGNFTVNGQSTC
ncbi:carbohydrate esterase family 4 protein [Pseudomassariella vexata]|uniref:Carbohydrate esterase family 4 protein n=1 Tax=Pseudomassariella vexata TaxID=1141098 RepID=A0A1Y2E7B8_9PEZI|nr:carbohydrate esterase family 4 protein [Pseudomassariella vexata]ORY67176.1 carbohydrate esterase family 4 protein [Pseudomassariella vexata]